MKSMFVAMGRQMQNQIKKINRLSGKKGGRRRGQK
jgi:hypothetical protein